MKPKLFTIGVYGFDRDSFFRALLDAQVDTFCDIRRRRGMRGAEYAFVNSTRLQQELQQLGIRYIYIKDLAPSQNIRNQQKIADKLNKQAKRTRKTLEQTFIAAYETECLSTFDPADFMQRVGSGAKVISLFCVERDPLACHRSLAAKKIAHDLNISVEHITPQQKPLPPKN